MASDTAIVAILEALSTREDAELAEVSVLIEALPAAVAPALLLRLGGVEAKRRRWACEIAAAWGPPAVEAAAATLRDSTEDYALDLLYLVRRVGGDRAIAVLEQALRHGSPVIRAGALRLYAEVAPAAALELRARTALVDDDVAVRAIGLEVIVARRPEGCARWIATAIDDGRFGNRELGEKKQLFVAYARVGGEPATTDLLAWLDQRNLIMKSTIDDDRIAAAGALGEIGYAPARPVLERLAKAKLSRGRVTDACSEALAQLDRFAHASQPITPIIDAALTEAPVKISFKKTTTSMKPLRDEDADREPTPAPAPLPPVVPPPSRPVFVRSVEGRSREPTRPPSMSSLPDEQVVRREPLGPREPPQIGGRAALLRASPERSDPTPPPEPPDVDAQKRTGRAALLQRPAPRPPPPPPEPREPLAPLPRPEGRGYRAAPERVATRRIKPPKDGDR